MKKAITIIALALSGMAYGQKIELSVNPGVSYTNMIDNVEGAKNGAQFFFDARACINFLGFQAGLGFDISKILITQVGDDKAYADVKPVYIYLAKKFSLPIVQPYIGAHYAFGSWSTSGADLGDLIKPDGLTAYGFNLGVEIPITKHIKTGAEYANRFYNIKANGETEKTTSYIFCARLIYTFGVL